MRPRVLLAAALGAIVAAPLAYAAPAPTKVARVSGVVRIEDRHEVAEERDRCEALSREERDLRDQVEHARDREDRERLEARRKQISERREHDCR